MFNERVEDDVVMVTRAPKYEIHATMRERNIVFLPIFLERVTPRQQVQVSTAARTTQTSSVLMSGFFDHARMPLYRDAI